MRRWTTGLTAALLLAMAPAFPAAADTPSTLVLVSGGAAFGAADPATDVSRDGGATWADAQVMIPVSSYAVIPGTAWINDGVQQQFSTTLFRREFVLPDGASATGVTVCVHSDNATTVSLNGEVLGAQRDAEIFDNFIGDPECFSGVPTAGRNVLDFAVHNFSGPMGLDYRAEVTYTERVNTPPVLRLPADLTVDATSPAGAPVEFGVTADDDTDGVTVSCTAESGTTFAIGTTTVDCTATDSDGATASGSFTVTVRGAPEQLADLLVAVTGVGPGRSLAAKIQAAIAGLSDGAPPVACEPLHAFVQEVRAQSGKSIPADQAASFVEDATRIRAVLGCR